MAARPCAGLAFPCGGLHDADAFGRTGPSRLPVRGPCVSVRRSCDADAFGRTGPTRARARVWRFRAAAVRRRCIRSAGFITALYYACFTAARPCMGCALSSCKPYFRHGRRLPRSPVACKRCGFESSDVGRRRKKESGDDMRGDRRHERAVMVSARSLPAVSRIPPRPSPPLVDGRRCRRQTGRRLADVPRARRKTLPFPLPHNMTFENGKV